MKFWVLLKFYVKCWIFGCIRQSTQLGSYKFHQLSVEVIPIAVWPSKLLLCCFGSIPLISLSRYNLGLEQWFISYFSSQSCCYASLGLLHVWAWACVGSCKRSGNPFLKPSHLQYFPLILSEPRTPLVWNKDPSFSTNEEKTEFLHDLYHRVPFPPFSWTELKKTQKKAERKKIKQ